MRRTRLLVPLLLVATSSAAGPAPSAPLQIAEYVADSTNFHAVSVILYGPTEALLVDAQNNLLDGRRLAAQVAALGRRLVGVVITHPDHDHYTGAQAIVEAFPGVPVYMSAAGIEEYDRTAAAGFARMRARGGPGVPDSLVAMRPLPGAFTVDGVSITVLPDLQGDVERPTSSVLWIPSQRTLVTGDVVFSDVHPWLGASTPATRSAWRNALAELRALHASVVVPGHKPDVSAPNTPDAITFTADYLTAFDEERARAADAEALIASMQERFPRARLGGLLAYAARMAFRTPDSPD